MKELHTILLKMRLQLEPRNSQPLNLRAEPELVAAVDRIAVQLQTSRSAIARAFIRQGIQVLDSQQES